MMLPSVRNFNPLPVSCNIVELSYRILVTKSVFDTRNLHVLELPVLPAVPFLVEVRTGIDGADLFSLVVLVAVHWCVGE